MTGRSLGIRGEELAARLLTERGYRVLERNVRLKSGEIDLVAEEAGTVVFVEVKARTRGGPESPLEAVDRRKQARLTGAATEWLAERGLIDSPARFDVIAVHRSTTGRLSAELYKNAFEAVS